MTPGESPLAPFLAKQGVVILDGGLATTLEARGHVLDAKLWSAGLLRDDPDAVRAVHRDFLEAGADIIATVGYQASFAGFAELGVPESEALRYFRLSVALAVEARDAFWAQAENRHGRLRPLVAASVGPYGAYLADGSEYDGRYGLGAEELDGFHRRRFELLAASEADLVACETIPSLLEARVLLGILSEQPAAWGWISFSCRDGAHLNDGTPVEEAARACEGSPGLAAVGVNCTAPAHVAEVVRRLRSETGLPILAYPNSGEGYDATTKSWTPGAGAWDVSASASAWAAAGANGVGGCCRVGPEAIAALRKWSASRERA